MVYRIIYKSDIVYKLDDLECYSMYMYYKFIRGQIIKYIKYGFLFCFNSLIPILMN